MTAIIVDDELQSHEVLNRLIANNHADIQLLAAGYNVQEGFELIQKHRPDLVFLDVQMPDGEGFDLLRRFESPAFNVIFITGHLHYAVTAIRFSALDFLLKPINAEELAAALARAHRKKQEQMAKDQIRIFWDTLESLSDRRLPTRIGISTAEGINFKQVNDIIRLEAQQNYTEFTLANATRKILASTNIGVYEEQFHPYKEFMRVHRSHLINLLCVDKYVRADGGYLLMTNGDQVGVSRNYRDELQERLQKL